MKPKFKTRQAWEQAQTLMQPTLIRVVDQLRQRVDESPWEGEYEDVEEPLPGFQLRLQQGDRTHVLNLWDLCFQVCCLNYPAPHSIDADPEVDLDLQLLDAAGEVEWNILDEKVRQVLATTFATLESSP
ncbi:hypothetical protein [Spirulina major]|jgi:hypothetical protein|uniref:hypothetical protein n=1 Tax=Spirulina major TaxID=270636 RepID=UPI00093551D8|nr:hypothetical protein [Spirulina major]